MYCFGEFWADFSCTKAAQQFLGSRRTSCVLLYIEWLVSGTDKRLFGRVILLTKEPNRLLWLIGTTRRLTEGTRSYNDRFNA